MFKFAATFATLTALSALTGSVAHAATDICLEGSDGTELRHMRVTWSSWFTTYNLETDDSGCVAIPTSYGATGAMVTVHATNRVVQMVDLGIPVSSTFWVTDNSTHEMGDDFLVAERLRRDYVNGFKGWGPFDGSSPAGGGLHSGPHITADLGSPLVVNLPYVEPAPVGPFGIQPPRIHLRSTDTQGETLHHELAHALHLSQWPEDKRVELTTYYIGWLMGEDNTHSWSAPSTDIVAFTEAFGGVGAVFEDSGSGNEGDFLTEADSRVESLREDRSGDDTIEGVVFGVLFHEYATVMGLDYVMDTYVSCEALTLQEYAMCIHDTEGAQSSEFQILRVAADVYGVDLEIAPNPGDWDYCSDEFQCSRTEGDCDSNAQCAGNLVCVHDQGDRYGLPAHYDVCELPMGHSRRCDGTTPCFQGEGDCDTNDDCAAGLYCTDNTGADYGMASWVDTCEPLKLWYVINY